MARRFYRFRSARAALEQFNELERQEIYFCPPDDLNDGMEGFHHVVWRGDAILWRNLIRHYMLCLIHMSVAAAPLGPEFDAGPYKHIGRMAPEDLPDAPIREMVDAANQSLLGEASIQALIDGLASRDATLSAEELIGFLNIIHPLALDIMLKMLSANGVPIFTETVDLGFAIEPTLAMLEAVFALFDGGNDERDKLAETLRMRWEQQALLNDVADEKLQERRGWLFLMRDFPAFYVDALTRMLFPTWLTTCFVKHPDQTSMWGVYGDGHRGICLEFTATPNNRRQPALNLHGIVGYGGGRDDVRPMFGNRSHIFEPVHYTADYPETDFFRSLGRLPRSKLQGFWYVGADGTLSERVTDIVGESEVWRHDYWARHSKIATTKLPQWAHEHEYRLLIADDIDRDEDQSLRKVRYDFKDLTGIIFGMKMTHADKIEVLRIAKAKVAAEKHTRLRFYQATYSRQTDRIEIVPLTLLTKAVAKLAEPDAAA